MVPLGAVQPGQATGQKVRIRADGRVVARLDRGDATTEIHGPLGAEASRLLRSARVVLVSDYGRGVGAHEGLRDELAAPRPGRHVVWDPHPRGPAPTPGTLVVTPNEREAAAISGRPVGALADAVRAAEGVASRWSTGAVVVTRGAAGAVLVHGGGTPLVVPARRDERGHVRRR